MKRRIRLIFQLVFLGIILYVVFVGWNIEKYCPLGGMLTLGTKLYQGTMACNMTAGAIFMAAALALGALAIGKLFCAFICPIGTITEWLGKFGKKFKLHFDLPKIFDRILRAGKYFLFFWVFYLTITRSELFCRTFDPYYAAAARFQVKNFPPSGVDSLSISISEVENLFDAFDNYYLLNLLSQHEGVYGFESYYGEPAKAAFFYHSNQISAEEIVRILNETKSLKLTPEEAPIKLNFLASPSKILSKKFGRDNLHQRLFQRYFVEFNQTQSVEATKLHIYEIGITNIDTMQLRRQLPFLVSHLSAESGLHGFATTFTNRPIAQVYFNPLQIDTARISRLMLADTLLYYKQDNSQVKLANSFLFQHSSRSYSAENFKDPVLEAQQLVLE